MRDSRDAWRALRATPLVSCVAILSLALGIGANSAIFSILNAILLRQLPVHDPARVVYVTSGDARSRSFPYRVWADLRDRHLFADAAASTWSRFDLSAGGETQFADGVSVSGSFFRALGVPALLGRTLSDTDDRPGAVPVAAISAGFWQRRYGGHADVLGRTITIERVAFTIVGVTPPAFTGIDVGMPFDVAVPLSTWPLMRRGGLNTLSGPYVSIIGRLAVNQNADAASAALRSVQPPLREATMPAYTWASDRDAYLREPLAARSASTGDSFLRRRYERPLIVILLIVALVLAMACANIANLLLARTAARRRELGVRLALGASRGDLARQLLAESALFAAAGAMLGLLFAQWAAPLLARQFSTQAYTVSLDLSIDWRVLSATAAVGIATALLFGIVPALHAARSDPMDALRQARASVTPEARAGLGGLLVVAQVAISLVIVVAAGLLVRTFVTLVTLPVGFERNRVLLATVDARRSAATNEQRTALYGRVRDAAASVPGVASAAASMVLPAGSFKQTRRIERGDGAPATGTNEMVQANQITPDWFRTLGTPLVAGRDFTADDRAGTPPVAIVNQAFARRFFSGESPIGRTLWEFPSPDARRLVTVVGVAADAAYWSIREPALPTMYLPLAQTTDPLFISIYLTVRSDAATGGQLTRRIADAVVQVDPDLSLTFRSLREQVDASFAPERVVAMLSGFFGALALLLAALGLYGVTAYAVTRRRTEIGIRMALGAAPAVVVRLVLARVVWLVGAGIVVGGIAGLWAARFVQAMLFGVEPRDVATFAAAAGVLATVSALAGWLPARRAAQIDPASVLKEG